MHTSIHVNLVKMRLEMHSHIIEEVFATDRYKLAADDDKDLEDKKKCIHKPVLPCQACLV